MTDARQKPIVVALGSVPKDGGTFTFYRNQRPALQAHGIDLRCVTVGEREAYLTESSYVDDGCVLLAPTAKRIKTQAKAFADWCEAEAVDIVVGLNSEAILSALPHLPERIRAMSRCANAFDHGYRITVSCKERLARIVAITPRLEWDLTRDYGADPQKMVLIPNGIAQSPFDAPARQRRGDGDLLELGFLGRLEHVQKGVLHLPKIVQELNRLGVRFRLRIAGKGKHRTELEKALRNEIASGQVSLIGALDVTQVPDFLGSLDVYLFTSHFEGCPNALLEALMAGCAPVSWLIEGITDYIIEDGETGFICAMDRHAAFASKIAILANDRGRLRQMSASAAQAARARFTNEQTAAAYAEVFAEVMQEPPPTWTPVPWSQFEGDPNFEHSWRDWMPSRLRFAVKQVAEDLRVRLRKGSATSG